MPQRGFLPRERRNTSRSHADSHQASSGSHADSHPNPIASRSQQSHRSYSSRGQHSYQSSSGGYDIEVQSESRDRRFNAPPPGGDPGGDPVHGAVDDEERRRQEFFENFIKAGLSLVFAVFGGLFALSESPTGLKGGKATRNHLYAANGLALALLYVALIVGRRKRFAWLLMIGGGLCCIWVVGIATSQYFNLDGEKKTLYVGCLAAVYVIFVAVSFQYGELKLSP